MNKLNIYLLAGLGNRQYVDALARFASAVEQFGHQVVILHGELRHIGELQVDAIIAPGNGYGHMTGGLDKAIIDHIGGWVDTYVRRKIKDDYCCELNVGDAILVSNEMSIIPHVIYAPTMRSPKKLEWGNDVPYRATLAAFQQIHRHNSNEPSKPITSVIVPMMGVGTGEVPYDVVLGQILAAIHRYSYREPIRKLFEDGKNTDELLAGIWGNRFH